MSHSSYMLVANRHRLPSLAMLLAAIVAATVAPAASAPCLDSSPILPDSQPRKALSDEEIQALREEARGSGFLVLKDDDVLRGRVLAEGILMLPGARVYYESGTQIVSTGEPNLLLGTIVPLPTHSQARPETSQSAEGMAAGGATGDCSNKVSVGEPLDGMSAGDIVVTTTEDLTIDADKFFDEVHGTSAPMAMAAGVPGAESVTVAGGKGGNGANVSIQVAGVLTIDGTVSNGRGGDGADAQAAGHSGSVCGECGGNASAIGGDGGNAGSLVIRATDIEWNLPNDTAAYIEIQAGGEGGRAVAEGGDGGSCGLNCGEGGEGGGADANGGAGGSAAGVKIVITGSFGPDIDEFLKLVKPRLGALGGNAVASAGYGGNAGPCPCPQDGQDGGEGGDAVAVGGNGGAGVGAAGAAQMFIQRDVITLVPLNGSNGGHGGHGYARGGNGGHASHAANCPCDNFGDSAGDGGDGGDGGNADADGGTGGPAGGNINNRVVSGAGGNAGAVCGIGGKAGNGGDCEGDLPPDCDAGLGGSSGGSGLWIAFGGEPGVAFAPQGQVGSHGNPHQVEIEFCDDYPEGLDGNVHCLKDDPCSDPGAGDCCQPHDTPGCADSLCCTVVCDIAPFCCADSWHAECSAIAADVCPWLQCSDAPGDCPWDLNSDGFVDRFDVEVHSGLFGVCEDCSNCPGDFDGDCSVNLDDQVELLSNFGPCPD